MRCSINVYSVSSDDSGGAYIEGSVNDVLVYCVRKAVQNGEIKMKGIGIIEVLVPDGVHRGVNGWHC